VNHLLYRNTRSQGSSSATKTSDRHTYQLVAFQHQQNMDMIATFSSTWFDLAIQRTMLPESCPQSEDGIRPNLATRALCGTTNWVYVRDRNGIHRAKFRETIPRKSGAGLQRYLYRIKSMAGGPEWTSDLRRRISAIVCLSTHVLASPIALS